MAKNAKKGAIYTEVYTVEEFAKIFKLSRDVVLTLIRKGEIPAICFGNQQRIPRAVVDHYFAQATTPRQRGFGMWRNNPVSLAYINKLRDRDQRSAVRFLKDIGGRTRRLHRRDAEVAEERVFSLGNIPNSVRPLRLCGR